jgi:hypothetical protein
MIDYSNLPDSCGNEMSCHDSQICKMCYSTAKENEVENKIKEVLNSYKSPFSFNGIETIEDAEEQEVIIDYGFYEDKDFADVVVLALNEFWAKNEQ